MRYHHHLIAALVLALPILTLSIGFTTSTHAAPAATRIFLPLVSDNDSATARPTTAPIAPASVDSPLMAEINEVVRLTNVERAAVGCPALALNAQLTLAAQRQTDDMALADHLSHTGTDGSSPWDRITATGYQWQQAAENVAAGFDTPADVVQGWMDSPGHRANILNCSLREIGVGYAVNQGGSNTGYWTQDFATPR